MRPLLDGDIFLYELGFSSEKTEEIDGEKVVVPASWDFCQDLLEQKLRIIKEEVGATEPPLFFFTNTPKINKTLNKQRVREDKPKKEYVENFRVEAAKEKVYKGGRKSEKPFHFYNLLHHILGNYDTHVNEEGLEADDALCIHQYSRWKQGLKDTIICSRDKDVRQCPGWHYSWELSTQAAIGPLEVDELGFLQHKNEGERDAKGKLKPAKIFGVGAKFFYYQLIIGDSVDNIGGVKGRGPVFGYNLLKDAATVRECYELVAEKYLQTWGDSWKVKLREQADLLYMIRELDEEGRKIRWKPPQLIV